MCIASASLEKLQVPAEVLKYLENSAILYHVLGIQVSEKMFLCIPLHTPKLYLVYLLKYLSPYLSRYLVDI